MMRYFVFLLLFASHFVFSQVGTGEWRLHVPTMEAIDVATKDSFVYTAYESGVMEYNIHTNEKVMLDKINFLSDIQVSCLDMDSIEDALYIGYKNGNIDKIVNNQILNIPAIKFKTNQWFLQEWLIYLYCNRLLYC